MCLHLCRVIGILLGKGYMELEETLLQWKQKNHLLDRLQVIHATNWIAYTDPLLLIRSANGVE